MLRDPILLMCAAFIVFAMLRFSIALMMFGCGLVYLWTSQQDIGLIVDQTLNSAFQLNVLLAIPMFVLAGNVMNAATISERIWAAADAVIGRTRAGLGHVTVLMNVVISSMSGSAVSDAAGAGMVAIHMMRKVGNYPGGLAVAITAAASCLGPIIPPSIPMVIYAILSGVSVGALFLSGVIPGLLMAVSLMLLIAWVGRRRGLPYGNAVPLRELPGVFGRALIPFSLPVVLLGGIWGGIFTPTEAAAVAAFWAMLIGVGIYRNLGLKALYAVFVLSARQSTVVMMLIVSSFIVNFALEREGVAQGLAAWITSFNFTPLGFQLAVNVMFLILGTVLDGAVMLLVFVPVLLPAAKSLGIDLVHFGLVVILNFMIAQITPPYGLILFVLSALTGVPMREINREIWQFCVPLTIVLFLLILFPAITLWLPWTFGYKG
ncbi:TRAP transporter large permease [Rhodoplanes sp. Z2-YC6860]|uniref:TRAP transporter large permease n=1 Tax=Rhodoplanes sp. Z2-YC6860 TaxID=674703 RepID=UPI00078C2640|nr:TRAP transporter large permease [Rhodoplanes sp. Z2-YC6860]AMN43959.1 TRAP dicarboxylate transporter subunit DctM [Rhodoplanes sp. Z2-YC6860]